MTEVEFHSALINAANTASETLNNNAVMRASAIFLGNIIAGHMLELDEEPETIMRTVNGLINRGVREYVKGFQKQIN